MPAKSKAQQKFMGMVHAAQKGEKPVSAKVAKVAKRMKKKDAEDYASTKHKGLPKKMKEFTVMKEDWWSEMSPPAQDKYIKDHPDSEKAKSDKKSKEKGEKEKQELTKKLRSGEYELDSATGKAVKKKDKKEDPEKTAKHVQAIKKGIFPGTPEYKKFMEEIVDEEKKRDYKAEYQARKSYYYEKYQ